MKNTQKWILGISLAFAALLALPFALQLVLPYDRHGMIGYRYDLHMPMIYGGYGTVGFGMLFLWLVALASLVLIGLGIAWLIKALGAQNKV